MMISLLVAVGANRVIGKEGRMPWHLPAELAYFKKITWGHPIVMGRKTYEAIGKPLPGRRNIVLTKNSDFNMEGCEIVHSIQQVLDIFEGTEEEVFIIGGEDIFRQFIEKAARLYITTIHHAFEGDRYFPYVNLQQWKLLQLEKREKDDVNPYAFTCYIYEK